MRAGVRSQWPTRERVEERAYCTVRARRWTHTHVVERMCGLARTAERTDEQDSTHVCWLTAATDNRFCRCSHQAFETIEHSTVVVYVQDYSKLMPQLRDNVPYVCTVRAARATCLAEVINACRNTAALRDNIDGVSWR